MTGGFVKSCIGSSGIPVRFVGSRGIFLAFPELYHPDQESTWIVEFAPRDKEPSSRWQMSNCPFWLALFLLPPLTAWTDALIAAAGEILFTLWAHKSRAPIRVVLAADLSLKQVFSWRDAKPISKVDLL
jgi:hypothetical protein